MMLTCCIWIRACLLSGNLLLHAADTWKRSRQSALYMMHPFPFLQNWALWQRSLLIVIIFTWFFQGVIQIIIVFHFGWVFAAGIGLHHQFPFSGGFEGRLFGQGGFLFSFAAGLLCNELCLWECASLCLFGGLRIFMTGFFPWKSPEGLFAADSSPGFLSLCTL